MTGYYLKGNIGLKWVYSIHANTPLYFSAFPYSAAIAIIQLTFSYSNSTIETQEKGVKHVQS